MKTAMQEILQEMEVRVIMDGWLYFKAKELLKKEKEQQLNLICFLRTNDKMGKSVDDLYNEFYNQNK